MGPTGGTPEEAGASSQPHSTITDPRVSVLSTRLVRRRKFGGGAPQDGSAPVPTIQTVATMERRSCSAQADLLVRRDGPSWASRGGRGREDALDHSRYFSEPTRPRQDRDLIGE